MPKKKQNLGVEVSIRVRKGSAIDAVRKGAMKALGYSGKERQFAYRDQGQVKVSQEGRPALPVRQSRPAYPVREKITFGRPRGRITQR